MNFLSGLLLGFMIGCGATFYYFRKRWMSIKRNLEAKLDVDQALFEELMPKLKGEFITVNRAEVIMRDTKEDLSIDKILQQDE